MLLFYQWFERTLKILDFSKKYMGRVEEKNTEIYHEILYLFYFHLIYYFLLFCFNFPLFCVCLSLSIAHLQSLFYIATKRQIVRIIISDAGFDSVRDPLNNVVSTLNTDTLNLWDRKFCFDKMSVVWNLGASPPGHDPSEIPWK